MAGEIILILIVAVFLLVRVRAVMQAYSIKNSTPQPLRTAHQRRPVPPRQNPATTDKRLQRAKPIITQGPSPDAMRIHAIESARALPLWDAALYLYERWRRQGKRVWPNPPDLGEVFPDVPEAQRTEANRAASALLHDPNLGDVYHSALSHAEILALLERTHKGFSRRSLEQALSYWMFIYR